MTVDYSAAALTLARRYCGWVVTPQETVTVTLDGPGRGPLLLKSLHVTNVASVVEDGEIIDPAELYWSEMGAVHKRTGRWTWKPASIVVTFTHGYTDAPDFDAAVAQAASAMTVSANRGDPAMTRRKVDVVEYDWSVTLLQSGALTGSVMALLNPFRILLSP